MLEKEARHPASIRSAPVEPTTRSVAGLYADPRRGVKALLDPSRPPGLESGAMITDRAAKQLRTTRSAFAREALRSALERIRVRELERKHRDGYARRPVKGREFSVWDREQVWGD